jgi:hypothetical protein
VIKALRLRQKIDFLPSTDPETGGYDSLRFTVFKPGSPIIIMEVPNKPVSTQHGMLGHDMVMLPTWHFLPKNNDIHLKPDLSSDHSYDVSPHIIPQFCGYGRDVGVLLGEGRDPKSKKIVSVIDRRVAHFTRQEAISLFGWKEDVAFKGGFVFMMLELHVPSGAEGWNRRVFISTK